MAGEFSVWMFFPDGSYEFDRRGVDGEKAVERAKSVINSVGGRVGMLVRVIITDAGDNINFEWKFGEGVVFPPKETA